MDGEEDTVEYWLYPIGVASEAALDTLALVYAKIEEYTRNYVWTRDKFNLKVESLPPEVRSRVRNYIEGKSSSDLSASTRSKRDCTPGKEGKKIRVAIPDDLPLLGQEECCADQADRISAAILAKVLEERDKERRAEAKFCIDVGTQTHGWHLNPSSNNNSSSNSPSSMSSSASASPPFQMARQDE